MTEKQNPVLTHLKSDEAEGHDGIVTLSTGIRARIIPVGATLIEEMVSEIKPPPVPTWYNEDKGREEENPNDPSYIAALEEYQRKQNMAAVEAMIMMGLDLVDGVPEGNAWLNRLRFLERRGHLDLSAYDLEDDLDRELLFKKFVAVGSRDLILIGQRAGMSGQDVEEAAASFKS